MDLGIKDIAQVDDFTDPAVDELTDAALKRWDIAVRVGHDPDSVRQMHIEKPGLISHDEKGTSEFLIIIYGYGIYDRRRCY